MHILHSNCLDMLALCLYANMQQRATTAWHTISNDLMKQQRNGQQQRHIKMPHESGRKRENGRWAGLSVRKTQGKLLFVKRGKS